VPEAIKLQDVSALLSETSLLTGIAYYTSKYVRIAPYQISRLTITHRRIQNTKLDKARFPSKLTWLNRPISIRFGVIMFHTIWEVRVFENDLFTMEVMQIPLL
jgi:hypothetical protein